MEFKPIKILDRDVMILRKRESEIKNKYLHLLPEIGT